MNLTMCLTILDIRDLIETQVAVKNIVHDLQGKFTVISGDNSQRFFSIEIPETKDTVFHDHLTRFLKPRGYVMEHAYMPEYSIHIFNPERSD